MDSMDVQKKKLLEDLKEFPNSFLLDRIPAKRMLKVKKTITSQREEDPVPFNENADENLLSFLEMQLGGQKNLTSAAERNQKVRESEPANIVALANYANMLVRSEDLAKAKKIIDELKRLKTEQNYAEQVASANAELAYSYSKLGPRYHGQAKKIYEQVLATNPGQWQWKYRYGVVLQRCLNAESYIDDKHFDASDTFIKGVGVLREVIDCPDADKATAAKAWTKIGSMIFSYAGVPSVYKNADESAQACLLNISSERVVDTSFCMQEAIKRAPDDPTVLQECGRFYRRGKNNRNLEKARQYLEKSYSIHPTTFNSLHLGLLDVDIWNEEALNKKKRREAVKKKLSFDQFSRPAEQRLSLERYTPESVPSSDSGYHSGSHLGCEFSSATADLTSRMGDLSVKRNPEMDSQYSQLNDVQTFITYVLRSPKYLKKEYDPSNALLNHAIKMLAEASELCEHTSAQAQYHKGLVHRRLNCPAEALQCFKIVLEIETCSLFMKVNCYEQQGYCYVEMANQEENATKKTEAVENAIVMFFFAIENAVQLSLPFDYQCPSSLSLQDLLQSKLTENPRHAESQKQLSRLYQLLGQHSRALEYLDEILKLDPHDSNAYLEKARLLMSQREYEEAVNLLMMLLTTVHKEHVLEKKEILVDAAVMAAEENLRKGKEDIAREYFQRAYQTVFWMKNIQRPDEYEIYVTGHESDDNCLFHHFSEIITKYFGLSCISSNNIPPEEYEISYSSCAMEGSRNFLFVFSDAGLLTRKSKHFVETSLHYALHRSVDDLLSISVVGNPPQLLKSHRFNQVSDYSCWKDVQKDSPEFVDLVVSLFKSIIKTS